MGAASCDWVAAPFRFRFRGREDNDMEYTEGFKARMVQKMLEPAAMSACGLSRESGVPQGTLSRWLRNARIVGGMSDRQVNSTGNGDPAARRPQDWSAEEKIEVVLEAAAIAEEDLGAFLRTKGLHQADLVAWRKTVLAASRAAFAGERPRKSRKLTKEVRRIRELEKELDRKEKALAEAAALLILKKKVHAIWGDEDGSTSERKGS
jgi:transposase